MRPLCCRNAYNMVINKCGDRLYSGLVSKTTSHLASIAARIEAAQGDTFLSELRTCWVVHIKSMHMIRDILMVGPHGEDRGMVMVGAESLLIFLASCGHANNAANPLPREHLDWQRGVRSAVAGSFAYLACCRMLWGNESCCLWA